MQAELRTSETIDRSTREYFIESKNNGSLIKTEDSARVCVALVLSSGVFESGGHVDFFDVKEADGEGGALRIEPLEATS